MSADTTPPSEEVTATVDGEEITREVEPRLKLSDFLRAEGRRSVRVGCEHGVCGACTVFVDGDPVKSCLQYAVQADGAEIETAQGLVADDGSLHPIQEAFHEEHALQCGFCTSGFVIATKALLEDVPDPDRGDVERGLADNICRCTGYENIYEAVYAAADSMEGE